jgi:hypothetical protein
MREHVESTLTRRSMLIVEHDQPADPLHTAKVGFDYLHDLRF